MGLSPEQFHFCWNIQEAQNLVRSEGGVESRLHCVQKQGEFEVQAWLGGRRKERGASATWQRALDMKDKVAWEIPSLGTGY